MKDTRDFQVYKTRYDKLKRFIKKNKDLFIWYGSPKFNEGGWLVVTIKNKYQFENWKIVQDYYKKEIAI